MKKTAIIAILCLALLLSACGLGGSAGEKRTRIELTGDTAKVTGGGAKAAGQVVTIAAGGRYAVSGTLDNGQLVVDTGDDAMDVWLMLEGASVTNREGAAIEIRQAKNVYLSTLVGTQNRLASGTEEDLERFDGTQNGAALFSEDDLILSGEGELAICGYINNGVTCKDDLTIESGVVTVFAAGNGLRGSESVEIKGGTVTVTSGNDGVKTASAAKEGKGYVALSGGELTVEARGDGISAETELTVSGGAVTVTALGDGLLQSSKALKANTGLVISGGTLSVRAVEDAVRCSGDVTVSGGSLAIVGESDGIQSGEKGSGLGDITLRGGSVTVSAGQQALHARGALHLDGGTVAAYSGSAKQDPPGESTAVYLFEAVSGTAGDRLSLDGGEPVLTAAFPYLSVLYSDSTLSPDTACMVTTGARTIHARTK